MKRQSAAHDGCYNSSCGSGAQGCSRPMRHRAIGLAVPLDRNTDLMERGDYIEFMEEVESEISSRMDCIREEEADDETTA